VQVVADEVSKWVSSLPPGRRESPAVADAIAEVRWMVEELRVSLFAQQLGTRQAVSAKRIYRAMDTAQL
jgi:ATP-dependent helicase HrpA